MQMKSAFHIALMAAVFAGSGAQAQDSPPAPAAKKMALPGHSMMGPAFDEGPRQRAYRMPGMGNAVRFKVTTRSAEAQRFFNQGVAQLHGFWYLEAERSFRQAAALDPDCAMAYWGMAMCHFDDGEKANGFLEPALKLLDKASPKERMWIESLAAYQNGDKPEAGKGEKAKGKTAGPKEREKAYLETLEKIVAQYPQDIEAKAFLALYQWEFDFAMSKEKRQKVDALLNEVLKAEPYHPCHHYRIHLWDHKDAKQAVNSAARSGQSTPGIAHMWHMGGHTFDDLKRYADAAWQQEAAARVDHAQMIRNRLLPDEIHNYAHNNEWLIRNLMRVGRVQDALDLAKNMIELPQHPKYNSLSNQYGSAWFGRERLLDVLTRYELWDDLIALGDTVYLEPTDLPREQVRRLHALALACLHKGDLARADRHILKMENSVAQQREEQRAAGEKAEKEAREQKLDAGKIKEAREKAGKRNASEIEDTEKLLEEVRAYRLLATGRKEEARKAFDKLTRLPKEQRSRAYFQLGEPETALKLAKEDASSSKNEVQPLANYVDALARCGKGDEAKKQFAALRTLSAQIDLSAPVFQRIAPVARECGYSSDWRLREKAAADAGKRPDLEDLGPFRWRPYAAEPFALRDKDGGRVALEDYLRRGRPVVVLFYLGEKCAQCLEQLNAFAPVSRQFEEAGISLVAISTDTPAGLKKTFPAGGRESAFPFPLLSDAGLKTFKAYRAYDGFENTPLHGAFLIDTRGQVRWQDIGYQPFKEAQFLLNEAKRLLQQQEPARLARQAAGR